MPILWNTCFYEKHEHHKDALENKSMTILFTENKSQLSKYINYVQKNMPRNWQGNHVIMHLQRSLERPIMYKILQRQETQAKGIRQHWHLHHTFKNILSYLKL